MNISWLIYTKSGCSYCEKAKKLLDNYNFKYKKIDVNNENKEKIYGSIDSKTNKYRYFPIIFKNDVFIGGYTELTKLLPIQQVDNGITIRQPFNSKDNSPIFKRYKSIDKNKFDGTPYFNMVTMIYLSYKFPIACVVLPIDLKMGIDQTLKSPNNHREISLRWIQKGKTSKGRISVPKNFWEFFKKCEGKKRFIIFPFGFDCYEGGHANYMIYDNYTKSLERFEPQGIAYKAPCISSPDLDKKIMKLFSKNLGKDFIKRYYKPDEFCPHVNIQIIQEMENEMTVDDPNGFCSMWCALYCDTRLTYPDLDRKEIVDMLISQLKNKSVSLTSFIRNYSGFMVEIGNELKKIKKGDLNEIFTKLLT